MSLSSWQQYCGRISSSRFPHITSTSWNEGLTFLFSPEKMQVHFFLYQIQYTYLHTTHSSCVLKVLNLVYLVAALLPPADFESLLKKTTTSRSTFLVSHSIAFFCHREYDEFPALQGMRDSSIFAILYFQGTGDTLLGPLAHIVKYVIAKVCFCFQFFADSHR